MGDFNATPASDEYRLMVGAGDAYGDQGDGIYWIDPEGTGAFQTYCEMSTNGGGWTRVSVKSW